jgi:membrane-associated phospholipid phosphatase
MRVAGFFLIFAPAGAALSIDRLIRVRKRKENIAIQPRPPWAQRMIQFELALLYFVTFCWKASGEPWVNGTALFYVMHLDEIHRFPIPAFLQNPVLLKIETWLTLAIEFSLGVLIWFRELRYPVLALGVVLHLWLEYSMNIPLFQWEILSAYVLFIDPDDLERLWRYISKHSHGFQKTFSVSRSPEPAGFHQSQTD